MSPLLATVAYGLLIAGLALLARESTSRVSRALWLPVVWLTICSSRFASEWWAGVSVTQSADQFTEGQPLDAFIFALMLVAGLLVLLRRGALSSATLRRNAPLVLFFVYCAVSILWSDFPLVALKRWIKAVGDVVMVLIVFTDPEPTAALRRLFTRAGLFLIPASILLIRYYPAMGRTYSGWTGQAYNIGVATGKNGLGYICLVFGLGVFWCLLESWRQRRHSRVGRQLIAYGALLVLTLWLFRMADSATSLGCFLIGSTLMVVASLRPLARPALMYLLVAAVLFVAVYGILINPGAGLVQTMGRDSTLTGRTALWNQLLPLVVNPLFGAGYESFWLGDRLATIWAMNDEQPNQAHNGYLEIFLDLGWIGVVMLSVLMVWGYRNAVAGVLRDPEGKLKLAFFVVAAVYNLTEHAFRELHPVWIAFLLAITVVPYPVRRTRGVVPLGGSRGSHPAPERELVRMHTAPGRGTAGFRERPSALSK